MAPLLDQRIPRLLDNLPLASGASRLARHLLGRVDQMVLDDRRPEAHDAAAPDDILEMLKDPSD
jgi:hypothetical protein